MPSPLKKGTYRICFHRHPARTRPTLAHPQAGFLCGASCGGDDGGAAASAAAEAMGLLAEHAYSILAVRQLSGACVRGGGVARLLQLRNPWGKLEWSHSICIHADCARTMRTADLPLLPTPSMVSHARVMTSTGASDHQARRLERRLATMERARARGAQRRRA